MRDADARVVVWHERSGGHNGRLAGHALRLLHEAVELCVACGAAEEEVAERVRLELTKARDRGDFNKAVNVDGIREELADVRILGTVLAHHTGDPDLDPDVKDKVSVLMQRDWEADRDGVLWRPGRSAVQP